MKCVLMGIAIGMFDRRRSSPLKSENAMNLDNKYLKHLVLQPDSFLQEYLARQGFILTYHSPIQT